MIDNPGKHRLVLLYNDPIKIPLFRDTFHIHWENRIQTKLLIFVLLSFTSCIIATVIDRSLNTTTIVVAQTL